MTLIAGLLAIAFNSGFHIQVAVASQSARLARREANLQAEVAGFIWLPVDPGVAVAAYIEEKHAIATAIASENAQKARRLAESHVMGQLARLTEINFELSTRGTVS